MTYYVRRIRPDGYAGWTGPLTAGRARREAEAWNQSGWTATVVEATPSVRASVRAWIKTRRTVQGVV